MIVEAQHPDDFAAVRAAGQRLGWTTGWVDTVLHGCLAVVVAWTGGTIAELKTEKLQRFKAQLQETPTVPRSSARAYRARLASLRQPLFELSIHDQAPRRRPWGRTLEQRFADVDMADAIRTTLLRYVTTRACVMRPRTVESLVNDLLPFAEFLTAHHSDVADLAGPGSGG